MKIEKDILLKRFLQYVKFDTQSNPLSETCPSSPQQFAFAEMLAEELHRLGATEISLDANGYVFATIPATIEKSTSVIGFIAHMDTSPDFCASNIQPQIVENYDGNDIVLNAEKDIVLRSSHFPEIKKYIGQTIVTTDGTTLLGADDKAGIAAIMCAAEYLLTHPEISHGIIRIGFTPDEEIGRGANLFDVQKFAADYAFTIDGGEIGELEYENFNAAEAFIAITGNCIHPGYAKGKMINALNVAHEFHASLPVNERPETTDEREGFFHLTKLEGSEESAVMHYIIREFERENFENRKAQIEKIAQSINEKYSSPVIAIKLSDQYYNMYEKIAPHKAIIEKAKKAILESGIKPLIRAARGGTDGARLSYMGLPCPNIFCGVHNMHGKYEFVPAESMQKATEVILRIATI